jgi:hypothetical protein
MKLHFISMLLALLLPDVSATSFHAESIESFASKAVHIVRGTVRSQRVEKVTAPNGDITLYTYALVEVKEPLKGGIRQSEIRIRKIGGESDGYRHVIPGSPDFKENEDTVLFLTGEQEDGSYEIESLEMGKFGIRIQDGAEVLTGGMLQFSQDPKKPGKPFTLEDLKKSLRIPVPTAPVAVAEKQSGLAPAPETSPTPGVSPDTRPAPAETESGAGPAKVIGIGSLLILGFLAFRFRRKH